MRLELQPVTLREASAFIAAHHRHHLPPQGHKFSIGLSDGERVVGVIVVGRPVARNNKAPTCPKLFWEVCCT